MTNIVYKVLVKKTVGDDVLIDFESKKEKWEFIKDNMPDLAFFITTFNSDKNFKFHALLVNKEWLFSLKGVSIENYLN